LESEVPTESGTAESVVPSLLRNGVTQLTHTEMVCLTTTVTVMLLKVISTSKV